MFFTSQQIQLPHDIIVYLSNFLRFEDFRNFIRALSPNGNEHELLQREHLWQLSTHKFTATFLNGKSLEIEYNFDPERTREKWVLVKVESLSPVIGEVVSPTKDTFVSLFNMQNFLDISVNFNKCLHGRHASCYCTTPGEPENMEVDGSKCVHAHYHHFCAAHVGRWLRYYLLNSILLRESQELYSELIATTWESDDHAYLQEEAQATPEFWLEITLARGSLTSGYSSDDSS